MVCLTVWRDNPQSVVSGLSTTRRPSNHALSHLQHDKQNRPSAWNRVSHAKDSGNWGLCNNLCIVTHQVNTGHFGFIPIQSGRFSPGCFGPISGVSCFSQTGAGGFDPVSNVGCFSQISGWVVWAWFINFGKTGKILGWVNPDFA